VEQSQRSTSGEIPAGVPGPPPVDRSVQLRLRFTQPLSPQRLRLSLRGLTVLVSAEDGDSQRAASYLQSVGVSSRVDEIGLISFPVEHLARVLLLPERVVLLPVGDASTLLRLLDASRVPDASVVVSRDSPRVLNLNWIDPTGECNEPIDITSCPALLALGVPLVADRETWDALRAASALAVARSRARVNLDGFVEITTSLPQQFEGIELPGLFRIDDTRFGLPLASAARLVGVQGLVWDGPAPTCEPAPATLEELPLVLSRESRGQLHTLVERIASARGQAVVWPTGTGRRVFTLAAVEALDGYPLVILARPAMLWAWRRHLDLLGRRPSLLGSGEVHLVPYGETRLLGRIPPPSCLLLDELEAVLDEHRALAEDLRRFDGDVDSFRLAVSSALPSDPGALLSYFSLLRPSEFRSDLPLALRYAPPVEDRLREHTDLYVLRRPATEDPEVFRRSHVERVRVSDELSRSLARIPAPTGSAPRRREHAHALLRWAREGTDDVLSPKLARAVALARTGIDAGRSVAVLAGSEHARRMLVTLLRPAAGDPLEVFPTTPRTVAGFETVVVLDPPRAFSSFDRVVVDASDSHGPQLLEMLHLEGSIEDRLAALALLRSERSGSSDPDAEFTTEEVDYLLGDCSLA